MVDTIPLPLDPLGGAARAAPAFSAAEPPGHALPITFSGSGSEYFRIWAINLLLTLVTLGLYHPWAKVRRLRYFYGNTALGEHTFDFHGDPKRMLRGLLLVGAMVLLYSVAGQISPTAGLIAFVIVAAVWPALFRASQQFRMANTSWRGLRFRFNGDQAGAYRAVLPLFIPGALTLAAVLFSGDPSEGMRPRGARVAGGLVAFTALLSMLLFPWFFWLLKKYQHDHYAFGQVQTELRIGVGSFYGLALKTAGVALLAALAAGAAAAILGGAGSLALLFGGGGGQGRGAAAVAIAVVVMVFVAYLAVILVVQPYIVSRLQNLVWGRTHSRLIRFESALRFWPLLRLTLKNWGLIILTLGLYGPFAKVAMARMRLQAVTVHMLLSPDELVSTLRERADDATGDAAGDLFGIDIGL
jgi:uncharacterized membrane protein YjgN (DUF898 family)